MYFPYYQSDLPSAYGLSRLRDIEALFRGILMHSANTSPQPRAMGSIPKSPEELLRHAESVLGRDFLGFFKPYDASLPETHPNCFYMEREWRRIGNMKFEPKDVGHIVVPARFVDSLRSEFPKYAHCVEDIETHAGLRE